MEKLNMANMNTLFKKGYLLAGVVMAANMFVVNEMKATENDNQNDLDPQNQSQIVEGEGKEGEKSGLEGFIDFLLSWEGRINFFGTLALSGANNYFKWWDYNAGTYGEFWCIGWRSKRLLNDIFQFEINFNGVRGAAWTFLYILDLFITKPKGKDTVEKEKKEMKDDGTSKKTSTNFTKYIFNCTRGFVSMPLTVHIAKFDFSISISLDSIIWAVIGKILEIKGKKDMQKQIEKIIDKKDDKKENEIEIKEN